MTGRLLTFLPWDSAHFGFRIARAAPRQLDSTTCNELLAACKDQAIDCLYFLADAADQNTISVLQANRFDFVDIRLTLAARFLEPPPQSESNELRFRLGHKEDLDALLPIASDSHKGSRFYVDRRFGGDAASQMYKTWLRNSLTSSYADAVIVADLDQLPVGYVTCHLNSPAGEGNIGLVGVSESARGKGCARGMILRALEWFHEKGFDHCNVVTQGRNIPAQRLYQRCGFLTRSVELWFHKWFTIPD